MEHYILVGKKTKPADLMTWARWFEAPEARIVKVENVGPVRVSTVFLGIPHGTSTSGPLLFETMVFGGELDGEQDRYATYAEAEKGHAEMVERVKAS